MSDPDPLAAFLQARDSHRDARDRRRQAEEAEVRAWDKRVEARIALRKHLGVGEGEDSALVALAKERGKDVG